LLRRRRSSRPAGPPGSDTLLAAGARRRQRGKIRGSYEGVGWSKARSAGARPLMLARYRKELARKAGRRELLRGGGGGATGGAGPGSTRHTAPEPRRVWNA